MNIKKWISLAATAFVLHTTPAIHELKAQTSDELTISIGGLDTVPVAKLSPEQVQTLALDQINKTRQSYNKAPLQLDTSLSKIAQDYADKQQFDHTPQNLKTRVESAWYQYIRVLENISDLSHAPSATIALAIQGQEESPLHKNNLLSEKVTYVWVGFCQGILVVMFSDK